MSCSDGFTAADIMLCLVTPVAGQVEEGDIGEEERSMGREAGQTVVMETQSLKAGHIPEPLPREG